MNQQNFTCYNCKISNQFGALLCSHCQAIQPISEKNYFKIFSLQQNFSIDKNKLEESYLNLQQLLHPDNFQQKSAIELNLALQHTSMVNEAYLNLKSDLKRSEYLLKIENIIVNQDNKSSISPDNDLLNYIFNLRDEIEDIEDQQELKAIKENIKKEVINIIKELEQLFTKKQYDIIAKLTIKLRYLEKIQEELAIKLAL